MTLNEPTKESKAEIQLSKHPFPISIEEKNSLKKMGGGRSCKKKINKNKHTIKRISQVKSWFLKNKAQIGQTAEVRKLGINALSLNDL